MNALQLQRLDPRLQRLLPLALWLLLALAAALYIVKPGYLEYRSLLDSRHRLETETGDIGELQGRIAETQTEVKPPSADEDLPEAKTPTKKEVSLSDLKGVGKKTEERLREAGYKSPRSIARAKPSTLSGKTGLSEKVASRLIEASKELLK